MSLIYFPIYKALHVSLNACKEIYPVWFATIQPLLSHFRCRLFAYHPLASSIPLFYSLNTDTFSPIQTWYSKRECPQNLSCTGQCATWHSLEQYCTTLHSLQTGSSLRSTSFLQWKQCPVLGIAFLASEYSSFKHEQDVRLEKNFNISRILPPPRSLRFVSTTRDNKTPIISTVPS